LIKGRYTIKDSSGIVYECENVITSDGLSIIRNYLAGNTSSWAGSIAVGALNSSAPTSSDSKLEFEISRVPVLIYSVEDNEIVLNATLSSELEGRIYELGVYPAVSNASSRGFDDKVIATFSETWTDAAGVELLASNFSGTEESVDGRSGYRNLIVSPTGITAHFSTGLDTSGYTQLDSMTILYNTSSTGANRTVRVTLVDDQLPTAGTRYYDFTLIGSSTGYKTVTALLGNFVSTGNFNNNVSKIIITYSAASGCTVHLDAIKFDDTDESNLDFALVSRALVGTPGGNTTNDYIIKPSGVEMDVEYRLEIT
jgi:hypothetical protein